MKSILYTILFITFLGLNQNKCIAQNIFLGTWEYQQGNEVFRVNLIINPDDKSQILGHYEKVQISNGIETYIYSSNKEEFVGNNKGWLPYAITIRSGDNSKIYGTIYDNTVDENLYHQFKVGRLTFEIVSNSGGLTPIITAHWVVERQKGLIYNEAPDFNIPTDIILTKVY